MTPASTSGIHESAAALVESMQTAGAEPGAHGISSPFAIIVTSRRIFRRRFAQPVRQVTDGDGRTPLLLPHAIQVRRGPEIEQITSDGGTRHEANVLAFSQPVFGHNTERLPRIENECLAA